MPVFLVVTTSAAGVVSAKVQFRGADIGTTSNIYVFASAPQNVVLATKDSEPPLILGKARRRDGRKDTSVN